MIYGSVCSGIEAASVAWHELGWRPAFFSEIEAFPRAVLQHRWPDVPLHGDFTTIKEGDYEPIDVLVGGTPCQDFSVAGLRAGLDGARGGLTIEFARLAGRLRPQWLVWENVPGLLSIDGGQAFGTFLWELGQLGYGFAYRILDAQYFGVPQRRRRIFVVGYLGDWRPAAAVLLEPASLRGDHPPRREAGQGVAQTAARSPDGSGIAGPLGGASQSGGFRTTDLDNSGAFIVDRQDEVARPLLGKSNASHDEPQDTLVVGAVSSKWSKGTGGPAGDECYNLVAFDTTQITHPDNRSTPEEGGPCHPLSAGAHAPAVAFKASHYTRGKDGAPSETAPPLQVVAFSRTDSGTDAGEISPTLRGMNEVEGNANAGGQVAVAALAPEKYLGGDVINGLDSSYGKGPGARGAAERPVAVQAAMVRRLTPRECERLQGFPDDFTLVPYRGKPAADGPRYKALGNSMAVPCMRWIGRRIQLCEEVLKR